MNLFEKQKEPTIFSMGIDESARAHLLESARWAKFLAIIGFILVALMLLIIAAAVLILPQFYPNGNEYTAGYMVGMLISYVLIGGILFYMHYVMYRFANGIKRSMQTANQTELTSAFRNLKNMFRFWGILTLVGLLLYGIALVIIIVGNAMAA